MQFHLQSEKPVATDSPDHFAPRGTKEDNSRNRLFNRKVELLLAKRPLRVLDFGCAGGGFVRDCIDDGHIAVGLEGSDYSQRTRRAEWANIPQFLFTCDITAPFALSDDAGPAKFDLITGWEFMEHIPTRSIAAICANADKHLAPGGLLIFSISDIRDQVGEVVYHQTVQPKPWWVEKFRELGFTHHESLANYFGNDWIRGPYQGSHAFQVVMTRNSDAPPPLPSAQVPIPDLISTANQFLDQGTKFNNIGGFAHNLEYAILTFSEVIKRASSAEALYGRAIAQIRLGSKDKALHDLHAARALDPANAQIARALELLQSAPTPTEFDLAMAKSAPPVASPLVANREKVKGPKISIITPTFNCAKYLVQCIESVLAQGYENFEHIIVDRASTDGTLDILKAYKHVRWISEPDLDKAVSLNKGVKLATGELISWLNPEDYYVDNNVFHSVLEAKIEHPEADVFFGNTVIVDAQGNVVEIRLPVAPQHMSQVLHLLEEVRVFQPSIFYRRAVADKVGAYREGFNYSINLEYWLRMNMAGFIFQHIQQTFSKSRIISDRVKQG